MTEQAAMQAFTNVFHGKETKGCYFHFKHGPQGLLNRNEKKLTEVVMLFVFGREII